MTDPLDMAGPPLADALNADPPPEHVDAIDVELLALMFAGGSARAMTFRFARDDGVELAYARWLNPETGRVEYRLRGQQPA